MLPPAAAALLPSQTDARLRWLFAMPTPPSSLPQLPDGYQRLNPDHLDRSQSARAFDAHILTCMLSRLPPLPRRPKNKCVSPQANAYMFSTTASQTLELGSS
eukprot:6197628-Pleurochrysis_carterae.AAC.2